MKLNPWCYNPEEPRPTEVVAYPSTWISLLVIQVATQLSSRGWVDPVPDPILPEISRVQPGIEPGTFWMAVRRANHYTKQYI